MKNTYTKSVILSILSILIITNFMFAQEWESNNFGFRGVGIEFLNANTGFIGLTINSGQDYSIQKTTNKGVSFSQIWTTPVTTENSKEFGFDMINELVGYVYIKSTLYRTSNGGNSWQLIHEFLYEQSLVQAVKFYNDDLGYITFTSEQLPTNAKLEVWKITNGGSNRSRVYQSSQNQKIPVINSISISEDNSNEVVMVGYYRDYPQGGFDKLFSLVSHNGGASFTALFNGLNTTKFGNVKFIPGSSTNYRIIGSQFNGLGDPNTGSFCYSNVDASERYKITNSTNNMAGLSFVNSDIGFVYIGDKLYKTINSGNNWTEIYSFNSISTSNINSLTSINEHIVYSIDQLGNLLTHKLATNLYSYFDNQSGSSSIIFDNISYNTPSTSYLRGGNSIFSSNNILNPGQSNERIFYKWENNYMYSYRFGVYLDNIGNNFANYYKTKQLSNTSSSIAKSSQTKSIRDTSINGVTATYTVHESIGGIFYSKSTNYGATYQTEETVNLSTIPGAEEGNKNASLTVMRNQGTSPVTSTDANRNVAVVWEKYNSGTGMIEIKFAHRVLNTQQTGYEWSTYDVSSFSAPPNFESNPKCFVAAPLDLQNPNGFVIIIPHLRPSGSQKKLIASVRYSGQSQDYELDNGEISDVSTIAPYNYYRTFRIHFAYKKGDHISYRNETIGIDPFIGMYRNLNELTNNISAGDGYASRFMPDISLMNGVPVVSYSASYDATRLVQYENGATSYIPISRYPVIKVQRINTNYWSNYVIYNSNNVQQNPDIEGSSTTSSYILNYSLGNGQFKKVANIQDRPGYFCQPSIFTGTDSRLINNSFTGFVGNNLSLLTLSPQDNLFKIDKQNFVITNIAEADAFNVDNIDGVVNFDTIKYSFKLGPILIRDNNNFEETQGATFEGGTGDVDPILNGVEFNENLKSNPFSLNETQALLLGCNVTYLKDNAYYSISNIPYTVNLYNKTTGLLHRMLYQDTIHSEDSADVEYLRGYYITNIPNGEDSFYVKLEVDEAFDDGDFFINPIYYDDDEDQEAYGPVASLGYETAVIFEDNNQSVTAVNVIPTKYLLEQNYPNPFNPSTKISYSLTRDGMTRISVYDISGKEIAILINETKQAGNYDVTFNGSNFSSGVYFYRIESNDFIETKRMVLIK